MKINVTFDLSEKSDRALWEAMSALKDSPAYTLITEHEWRTIQGDVENIGTRGRLSEMDHVYASKRILALADSLRKRFQ